MVSSLVWWYIPHGKLGSCETILPQEAVFCVNSCFLWLWKLPYSLPVKELHDLCLCLLVSLYDNHALPPFTESKRRYFPPFQRIWSLVYNPLHHSPRSCHTWFSLCSLLFKQRFSEHFKPWFFPSSERISSTWIALSLAHSLSSNSQFVWHFLNHSFSRYPKVYTSP